MAQAMEYKAGTIEFKTGMFEVEDNIAQSGSKKSSGQIRVFKDHEGNTVSVYKVDAGSKKITFDGLLAADADLPEKGSEITIDDVTYYVDTADLIYKNDDAQKIRVTANLYADLAE